MLCRQSYAKGASGAGAYDQPQAGNGSLASADYIWRVLFPGLKGVRPAGRRINDEQAAAVVNSVRTDFGEAHAGAVSVEAARAVRPLTTQ